MVEQAAASTTDSSVRVLEELADLGARPVVTTKLSRAAFGRAPGP